MPSGLFLVWKLKHNNIHCVSRRVVMIFYYNDKKTHAGLLSKNGERKAIYT